MIYERKKQMTYNDIDAFEKISLIALLKYMTEANWENAEELGIGISLIPQTGLAFVTQRIGLKIHQLPTLGDLFTIRTWPAGQNRLTFVRKGEFLNAAGEKLIEWESLWVLIDINERKIKRPSELAMDVPLYGDLGVEVTTQKIKLPDPSQIKSTTSYTHHVDFSDLDFYKHMSNTIYANLISNVYRRFNHDATFMKEGAEIQFNYLNEGQIDDEVLVTLNELEDQLFIVGTTASHTVFTAEITYKESM